MIKVKQRRIFCVMLSILLIFVMMFGISGQAFATTPVPDTAQTADEAYIPGEYIIQYEPQMSLFRDDAAATDLETAIEDKGGKVAQNQDGMLLITTNENMSKAQEKEFLDTISNKPGVKAVEKNRIVTVLSDPLDVSVAASDNSVAEQQWGPEMICASAAWELLPGETSTVRVAVVDTGVDATHPDLAGRVIAGQTIISENSSGGRYNPNESSDDHGHGTHVSGVIAAICDNDLGIQGVAGNVNIEILPVKVLNDAGRGTTYDVINGIRYAADNGASIINLSLGSSYASAIEAEAVRYAQNKGCLLIAAAGNDSINVATAYPASYEDVISVGSVDPTGERSYFSNYGSSLDVAAPGSAIISTIPKRITLVEKASGKTVYGNDTDGYYIAWSGTSMACPHVVGVAALYKAANPMATGYDIGNHLINTAHDVGEMGPDIDTGNGIVDAAVKEHGKCQNGGNAETVREKSGKARNTRVCEG